MASPMYSVRLEGHRELVKALGELKASGIKRVARSAVIAARSPVNKAAKRGAPRETGLLRKSIGAVKPNQFVKRLEREKGIIVRSVGARSGFRRIIDGRPRDPVKYLHLVEYGTSHSQANPFLRRAIDQSRGVVSSVMTAKVKAGLIKEAERARRKAAARAAVR